MTGKPAEDQARTYRCRLPVMGCMLWTKGRGDPKDVLPSKYGLIDGAAAEDLDSRFTGWKSEVFLPVAIEPAKVLEPLDGVLVY